LIKKILLLVGYEFFLPATMF